MKQEATPLAEFHPVLNRSPPSEGVLPLPASQLLNVLTVFIHPAHQFTVLGVTTEFLTLIRGQITGHRIDKHTTADPMLIYVFFI
jgi:hypothetical protein